MWNNFSNKKMNITAAGLCMILSACSSAGGNPDGAAAPNSQDEHIITIDNAGVVPIIGDNPTRSVIYVHNNSDTAVSGIKYTANINGGKGEFLDTPGMSVCSTIPAHQSCPLSFTTPAISKSMAQGSALVSAEYSAHNSLHTFKQTISFARVDTQLSKGVQVNSGVLLSSLGNKTAYSTLYLYGADQNKIYTVDNIQSNKKGVQIIQGNITGKQVASNYVSAIEISAATNFVADNSGHSSQEDGFNAAITINSSAEGQQYNSTSNVGVAPSNSGAILISGHVPIINTSESATVTGTMHITNAGNELATLGSINYPAGVSEASNDCGTTLAAGSGCSITFTTPQVGGNGTISIPYSSTNGASGTTEQSIVWYNSINEALLQMAASSNPLRLNATVPGSTTVTVTNIGGYNLTNVKANQTVKTGSASLDAGEMVCSAGKGNLPIGGSCSYPVNVTTGTAETGSISLSFSGDYNNGNNKVYSRMLALGYTAAKNQAILTISPAENVNMNVVGDGKESTTQTLYINNDGDAATRVETSGITGPEYLTVDDGCKGKTLESQGTCTVQLKLGPVASSSMKTGNGAYTLSYKPRTQSETVSAEKSIGYTVSPNSQNITLASVTPSSGINGSGTKDEPFQIAGTLNKPTVEFRYANSGTNVVQVVGVINNNSPVVWEIDTSTSSCYSGGKLPSQSLIPGAECTIVFKNILAEHPVAVGNIGSSYTENLSMPKLVFKDMSVGTQFEITPAPKEPMDKDGIYVTGNQATIVNNVSKVGNKIIINHTLTNGTSDYGQLSVRSQMEDYIGAVLSKTACTTSTDNGVMEQTCNLSIDGKGIASAQVEYSMDQNYNDAEMHVLFKLLSTGKVVSFSPLSTITTLNLGAVFYDPTPGEVTGFTNNNWDSLSVTQNLTNAEINYVFTNLGRETAQKFKVTLPSAPAGWMEPTTTCPTNESNFVTNASCKVSFKALTDTVKTIQPAFANINTSWSDSLASNASKSIQLKLPAVTVTAKENKVIFVATNGGNGWQGNFGSVESGNNLCNSSSDKPAGEGIYKALLKGNNATAIGTTYVRKDRATVIATATTTNLNLNDDGTTPKGSKALSASIGDGTGNLKLLLLVWTGLGQEEENCLNWTSNDILDGINVGQHNVNDVQKWGYDKNSGSCNNTAYLYCVQQ